MVASYKMGKQNANNENSSIKHQNDDDEPKEAKVYPPIKRVLPSMLAIYLVFFLVALDRTIISTAIPTISAQFNSFGDIAWYEAAFLLPLCVLQLSFGLLFKYYSTKWLLFVMTFVFEVGSIVCATAPNSAALIVGRTISGIGAVGITPGAYLFITLLVPLKDRPKFLGALGSAFGITSILGPILGGYLTSVSWRWCFWINVPIGGIALVILPILAPNVPPPAKAADSWRQKILDLDPLGLLLFGPSVICLLFALQFGAADQNWSSSRIVALFVVFGLLLLAFITYQALQRDRATIPPRILRFRSVYVSCVLSFCIGAVLVIYAFYLPIWFQVVQGKSPQNSGLSLIPLLLSTVVSVVSSGILVSIVGYFTPFSIAGGVLLVVGSALISTWTADISTGRWIGYQIITGLGLGMSLQQPAIAVQTVLSDSDLPIGNSLINLVVYLGGTIFVTVSQTLFEDQLNKRLIGLVPGLDASRLTGSGATALKGLVAPDKLGLALDAYNDSLRSIWYLGLALACLALVSSCGLEWKNVKSSEKSENNDGSGENGKSEP